MKKTLFALCVVTLFASGSMAQASIQDSALQPEAREGCGSESMGTSAVPEEDLTVTPVNATITEIDYNSGLLNLDTELGTFEAFASPQEIQDLKKGDEILVYIVEDEGEGEELLMTPVAL